MGQIFRELDDLVLQLKGLVLVSKVRERHGAGTGELAMYSVEIDRVRDRLANLMKTGGLDQAAA
jgi:hypothetical protein